MARNYEEILDLKMQYYPGTSAEELQQIASKGFNFFRMAESIDKGLMMLGKVAKEIIKRGQLHEGVELLKEAHRASL